MVSAPVTAELHIDATSETCVRYTLVADGRVIWRNRVHPSKQGHEGARARMVAWATARDVTIVEAQPEPEPQPAQVIIKGRYGRH